MKKMLLLVYIANFLCPSAFAEEGQERGVIIGHVPDHLPPTTTIPSPGPGGGSIDKEKQKYRD